jgi:hypothetical protein
VDASFLISVPRALSYLYREGKTGHWTDVRTTAEGILALLSAGEGLQSPNIRYSGDYLIAAFRNEAFGGSWGSELWDTALAARAVHKLAPKGQDVVDKSFEWIFAKQLEDGSFDGEPWDSLFVCLSALAAGRSERVLRTIDWLISLQTSTGIVISRHYSGLFCQVLGQALDLELPSSVRHRFRQAAMRSLHALWDEYDSVSLWSEGTWTNAYVICGMLALRHPEVLGKCDEILRWYATRQTQSGAWDDTVRTAIVIQALMNLGAAYELEECNQKPLQTLTAEFLIRSTQDQLCRAVSSRTTKATVVRAKRLIDKDEDGNRIITLTPERQTYLGIIVFILGALWTALLNWTLIRRLLFK